MIKKKSSCDCDFNGKGMRINGIIYLNPKDAFPFIEAGALLVDLREEVYKSGREFAVKNKLWMPYSQFKTDFSTLPFDRQMIIADYVGLHSKEAVQLLKDNGFTCVASLNGGIISWIEDGLPFSKDIDGELVGGCACQLKPRKRKIIK